MVIGSSVLAIPVTRFAPGLRAITSTTRSTCGDVITRGGSKRITVIPAGKASTPRSLIACKYGATFFFSSMPIISPSPRTSLTSGDWIWRRQDIRVCALLGSFLRELVALHHAQDCQRSRAGQRVAAEGGTVQPWSQAGHSRAEQNRAHRQPTGDGFRQAQHIGGDTGMLDGKHLAGAAKTGLDFVDDQQSPLLRANLPGGLQIFVFSQVDAAFSLHHFQDDRRGIVRSPPVRALQCC